jgi:predicted lipoprotein with Yx(FWY)xxD motif
VPPFPSSGSAAREAFWVDSRGRALYRNEQEHGAVVLCQGACVSFWKPLVVHGKPKGK